MTAELAGGGYVRCYACRSLSIYGSVMMVRHETLYVFAHCTRGLSALRGAAPLAITGHPVGAQNQVRIDAEVSGKAIHPWRFPRLRWGQALAALAVNRTYWAVKPPSRGRATPVMRLEASEQSQVTAWATSLAVPRRPIGWRWEMVSLTVGSSSMYFCQSGVSM